MAVTVLTELPAISGLHQQWQVTVAGRLRARLAAQEETVAEAAGTVTVVVLAEIPPIGPEVVVPADIQETEETPKEDRRAVALPQVEEPILLLSEQVAAVALV